MAIPVPIPGSALAVTDTDNTNAETLLSAFVQVVAHGTSGSVTTTPAMLVPVSPNPIASTPVLLDSAEKQLFLRQMFVVLAKLGFLRSELTTEVFGELPAGAINGANTVYTTAFSFKTATTRVFLNGLRVKRAVGAGNYTETAANQITFSTPPAGGSAIIIDYTR